MNLLTVDELTELVDTTRHDFFRIETLPSYDTAITTPDFRRWLDGEAEPNWDTRRPWLDTLARWASDGRPRRRVRVIHDPPTDYERYACDWGYRHNVAAGELVRVLDLGEQPAPRELVYAPGDWSLIDGERVITMHYHPDGQFRGAQLLDASNGEWHRIAADTAWDTAVDFTTWWARHPRTARCFTRSRFTMTGP